MCVCVRKQFCFLAVYSCASSIWVLCPHQSGSPAAASTHPPALSRKRSKRRKEAGVFVLLKTVRCKCKEELKGTNELALTKWLAFPPAMTLTTFAILGCALGWGTGPLMFFASSEPNSSFWTLLEDVIVCWRETSFVYLICKFSPNG